MPFKPKILFIGDYCRMDYLLLLKEAKDSCDFRFLFFSSPTEEQHKAYQKYGQAVYWSDYRSAQTLLSALAPDKVLFLYIDTYHALVLNIACKNAGIPTFHLEHGMRADYAIGYNVSNSPELHQKSFRKIRNLAKLLLNLRSRIKARLFLQNSIRGFSAEDAAFVKEFISIRSKHNYLETFIRLPSKKRTTDYYISFSPKVFQVHQQYDQLSPDHKVFFIGVPYFDKLAHIKPATPQKIILFIDQPLAEHHLLQWTTTFKKAFVKKLAKIVTAHRFNLLVKPHPVQDLALWENVTGVELVDDEKIRKLCSSVSLVMSFYSTYLMPFAAMPHTTLITFENHPAGKLNVSKPFIEAGVSYPVYNLNELNWALEHIDKLHQQQLSNKPKFTEDWLYKFDGKSGERLRDILLKDDL
ncbi:polysialyltransferase family glycosyltransferase [Botryobacter ruber]|uniref:polysialyltransferase family glycosyltransferase n=1 Tax=Botryobacter ruber TaxID=2171629 RepID=UPI000E0A960F|nr:polysialyltransferase family glycosyltransferase [Botryobacter ruber]